MTQNFIKQSTPLALERCFLKTPSLKGKYWVLADHDPAAAVRISQGHGLPEMVGRLLAARGIPFEGVEDFLYPKLATHFPNPFSMANMEGAALYLADAVEQGKAIGILADFDVDGATSCGVIRRYIRQVTSLGGSRDNMPDVPIFIPDRLGDGYGPSDKGFDSLKEQGCDIVIVADCGITSHAPLAHAASIGLETIVLDHHEPEATLPEAKFIVNPKLKEDQSGLDTLAAVGVSFLMMVALNNKLREREYFSKNGLQEPDMKEFLDLVALGTVCDMVALEGANRLFVQAGFTQMAARKNPGIRALLEVAKVTALPDPYHAGFSLGPRINAGSRVHRSDLGARLLSTDDYDEALTIAHQLDSCNEDRKTIQKDMLREAQQLVKLENQEDDPVICVAHDDFHQGVSGLVAGALKDKYSRPACVGAFVKNEETGLIEGRGSGRSVKGINIAQAFIEARHQELLIKGGGHAMAGGYTVAADKYKAFQEFLRKSIGAQAVEIDDLPITEVDAAMAVSAASVDFVRLVSNHMGPYGMGNPEPVFMLRNVMVAAPDIVGANHVRCYIKDMEGGRSIKGICFRSSNSPLGEALLKQRAGQTMPMHLLGTVHINNWQGRESVDFQIQDAAFAL